MIRKLIANWFGKRRVERELDAELRFHLDARVDELRAQGVPPQEARRRAQLELGGAEQVKEGVREVRVGATIESIVQDVRYGARMLRRNPGFTIVAVLTLALGIGANTAIFSVVHTVLLRPLPYSDPERLVVVWEHNEGVAGGLSGASLPDFREWRARNTSFDHLASVFPRSLNITGEGEPEEVRGIFATSNVFTALGVQPLLGRTFTPQEETWGHHRVAILSHGLWVRRFGGAPDVLGRAFQLNGEPYTIVGVMTPGFQFPDSRAALWVPMAFAENDPWNTRGNHFIFVVGRLKPGVTHSQAQSEMDHISAQLRAELPENAGVGARLQGLHESYVGNVKPMLLALLGAVGMVLLITCTNVANLLLARASARGREVAIRMALGAGRGRVVRQLLAESSLLALAGGGLGLLLAYLGADALAALAPANVPRTSAAGLDTVVLLFTLAATVVAAMLFGLAPAFQAARVNLQDSLKEGGRAGEGAARIQTRNLLVLGEVALSLVLLIGAGLLIQSLYRLQSVSLGFDPASVLTLRVSLPTTGYPQEQPERKHAFFREALERIRQLPGVIDAGGTTGLPLSGGDWGKNLSVEGRPLATKLDEVPLVQYRQVTPAYFRALRIQVKRGRAFTEQDDARAPAVAIVNGAIVDRFFPNEDPLGKVIWMGPPESLLPSDVRLPTPDGRFTRLTIVGVVGDVRFAGLSQPADPEVFIPYAQGQQETWPGLFLAIRTSRDPASLVADIRGQIGSVDPSQPVAAVNTMEALLDNSLGTPRFNALLLTGFASLALLLAAVGVYGVVSYLVAQRAHEIGIRIALGAQSHNVLQLVLGRGLALALAGVFAGLLGAWGLTRFLQTMLFEVSSTDPVTYAAMSVLLVAVSLAACLVPARRATRVDPMTALRHE